MTTQAGRDGIPLSSRIREKVRLKAMETLARLMPTLPVETKMGGADAIADLAAEVVSEAATLPAGEPTNGWVSPNDLQEVPLTEDYVFVRVQGHVEAGIFFHHGNVDGVAIGIGAKAFDILRRLDANLLHPDETSTWQEITDLVRPAIAGGSTWDFSDRDEVIVAAWGIIANAYGGDWSQATEMWREAAERWRDGAYLTPSDASLRDGSKTLRRRPRTDRVTLSRLPEFFRLRAESDEVAPDAATAYLDAAVIVEDTLAFAREDFEAFQEELRALKSLFCGPDSSSEGGS